MGGTRDKDDVVMADGANDASMGTNVPAASESRDGDCDDGEDHDFGEGEGAIAVAMSVEQFPV